MEISGQAFINAPYGKVWRALQDAGTLDSCFQQGNAVTHVSDTAFQVGAPVNGPVEIAQPSPGTLVYQARQGELRVSLEEQGDAMTLMRYVLDADVGNRERAETEMHELVEAFQAQVSGPREYAASGAAGAQAAIADD